MELVVIYIIYLFITMVMLYVYDGGEKNPFNILHSVIENGGMISVISIMILYHYLFLLGLIIKILISMKNFHR